MVWILEYRKVKFKMERVFEYKNGMVRIMWNEVPMSVDYESICIHSEIQKETYPLKTPFLIGVELQISMGGRICYGLLGAKVKPYEKKDAIKVSVYYTNKNTIKYDYSSLFDDEFVYKGLPKEYLEYINNNVYDTLKEKKSFPSCEISFDYAANCEVGSSPMIFGIIAEMIINFIDTGIIEKISSISLEEFSQQYVKKIHLRY